MTNSNKILDFIEKKKFYGSTSALIMFSIAKFFCLLYFYTTHDIEIEYSKNYDPNENYVCVANHKSLFDPPIIGSLLNSPSAFIAKKELFTNKLFANLISLCSAIYLDRDRTGSSSIKIAKSILKKDNWKLLVFIEGTRSKTDELGKAQTGAAFLARLCKTPLVPIGISYRDKKNPNSRKKIIVKIGDPYHFSKSDNLNDLSEECLNRISQLCDYKLPPKPSES